MAAASHSGVVQAQAHATLAQQQAAQQAQQQHQKWLKMQQLHGLTGTPLKVRTFDAFTLLTPRLTLNSSITSLATNSLPR